jgi:hypothetical protein
VAIASVGDSGAAAAIHRWRGLKHSMFEAAALPPFKATCKQSRKLLLGRPRLEWKDMARMDQANGDAASRQSATAECNGRVQRVRPKAKGVREGALSCKSLKREIPNV